MKLLIRVSFLSLAFAKFSYGASIISTVRNTYLGDAYGVESVSNIGPTFHTGEYWKYSGNVILISDPNEQIYNLVLSFTRNPNQAPTWIEEDTLVSNVFIGNITQVSNDPLGQEFQTWQVNWATNYPSSSDNSVFGYYWYGRGNQLQSSGPNAVYVPGILIYGTATISVNSSAGKYDVASYPYTYGGLLQAISIPEPSSITLFLAIASFSMFRRCRP